MKKFFVFCSFLTIVLLTACGNDPEQKEILHYVNKDMKPLAKLEDKAVSDYESVTGDNYTDDNTLYDALSDKVIPEYNDFVNKLEGIEIESKDLSKVHEKYIHAANTQQEAFVKIEEAIEKQDSGLIANANQMLADARKEMREYQREIKSLANKHNVKIDK